MIEFGGPDLVAPEIGDLRVNTDSDNLRIQVGARIGLGDVLLEPSEFSTRGPFHVGLGAASAFLFQSQQEIGNNVSLFHRQNEGGIAQTLKDTFPFFLGAVDSDQATKRARLRAAKKELRAAEAAVTAAELEEQSSDAVLRELWTEARAVGLATGELPRSDAELRLALTRLRFERAEVEVDRDADARIQDRTRALEAEEADLRERLGMAVNARGLLLERQTGETGYSDSIEIQIGRLESLGLLPAHEGGDEDVCPICAQPLTTPDPSSADLSARLRELKSELESAQVVRPQVQRALRQLDGHIRSLRDELNALARGLRAADSARVTGETAAIRQNQDFVRGRLDAILGRTAERDASRLDALRERRDEAASRAAALGSELDEASTREQLTSRLNVLGAHLREYSRRLRLEEAENEIRLDVANLTIVLDTSRGPLPLRNIGSGENWVGYHVAAHLALHHYFVEQQRPVPRFLMLDQPSQAHFQSEQLPDSGWDGVDKDREAVRNMFQLFHQFAMEFAPRFQLIVVDHALYTDTWFADSVVHNWRGDEHLIPLDWRD
ncbi:DUF3732 domain-containing protein [Promicromonospora sp. NPDC060271]|uniref:DUF3732 domain-containing protein n=1 Tax=Promicromonospora sp. NPDC060271 TaxID=3347089 RepID=UPI003650BC30